MMKMMINHLGVLLGLLHVIYAVPSVTGDNLQSDLESYIQENGEPSKEFKEEVRKYLQENNNPGVQMAIREEQVENKGDIETYIQEDGEPSKDFKDEVQKDLKENNAQMAFREEQVEVEGGGVIRQGDTIALQTHIKEKYLSCHRHLCDTANCGGALFEGNDWDYRCRGEVFQIYKPTPGEIRSGDLIGLYYPLQPGNWLGCQGFECKKETCPGHSSIHYGFETRENWLRCYKNVYKIFAFEKRNGAPLYSGDNVMFYLVNTKTWLNGEGRVEGNNQCPESAPPRRYKFDECSHEIFTIIKR